MPPGCGKTLPVGGDERAETDFYNALLYLHNHLLHLSDPQKRTHYRKTVLSVTVRLKAALDVSPVRFLYALRVAFLLSVFTLAVQVLALPHGKWLLFTVASVPCLMRMMWVLRRASA